MLLIQMKAMNVSLDDVHIEIENNADNTIEFLKNIITPDELETAKMPEVKNLDDLIFKLEANLNKATQLQNYNNN